MANKLLLGREPVLWTALVTAVLQFAASFGIPGLNAGQAGALSGLVIAAVAALTVRPLAPALFTALVTAGAALLTEYGTNVSQTVVSTVTALVITVYSLITREQVTPTRR